MVQKIGEYLRAGRPIGKGTLILALTLLVLSYCGTKHAAQTDLRDIEQASASETQPQEFAYTGTPATEVTAPDETDTETYPSADEDAEKAPLDATPLEPQQRLELALDALQSANDHWRAGNLDKALASLDQGYELILQIDDEQDLDVLQEKEDLRLLISRRVVEIYAARKTVVGDLEKEIPLVRNEHVEREIKSFQTREKQYFQDAYARSGLYRPMILDALSKAGLPEQLSWLPLIESGFKTSALSRARALGLWQFIPSTGFRYGLSRNQWVDERMDPEKSTQAAIQYLIDLHGLFGDWMSALAGYNCGEGRVLRAIENQHISYLDDFWDLYLQLPRETARYVPRFFATLIILQDPESFGIELPEPLPPIDWETTEIAKSVKLSDLDQLAGVEAGSFKELNPELRYGVTPDEDYLLKAPAGKVETLVAGIDSLQKYQLPPDTYSFHRVRRGETLSIIARKYQTTVNRIVRANGLRNQHRIRQGELLKIPAPGSSISAVPSEATTATQELKIVRHRVDLGDSLWRLAEKYNTTIGDIRERNGLQGDQLMLGQVLEIPTQSASPSRTYRVRHGDTLSKIAVKNQVALVALLRANNLSRQDPIYPNQVLILP